MGNLNFYCISAAALVYSPDGWTKKQYIFSQHLGVKLFGPLWLDANFSLGNHLNYISERSFLVYNTYDSIKGLAGKSLSWYLRNTTLSAGRQWQQKESYTFSTNNYTTYKYNNHHLLNIALISKVNYALGNIYYYRKDFTQAEIYFDKVQQMYPSDYYSTLMCCWTKYFFDKKNEAKRLFNIVLIISPADQSAKNGLNLLK